MASSNEAFFQRPDFIEAHKDDFPPVRIAEGENLPLVLHLPAAK